MSVRSLRPSPSLLVASLVLIIAAGGVAGAAIPGSDGTIRGCYQKDGQLRVVDVGEDCRPSERMLRFNQQGPPGISGLQAIRAASEHDSSTRKFVLASCPPGKTVIGTGAFIFNAGGQVLLESVEPSFDLRSVEASAREAQPGGTPRLWELTATALCANVAG